MYEIPQISTSASSDDLSDKLRYPYFSRVVSPDRFQADAMVSFIFENGWNFFSILYSEGPYGENAARWIKKVAAKRDICVSAYLMLPGHDTEEDWSHIFNVLGSEERTDIITLALGNRNSNAFFSRMKNFKKLSSKLFIGMDSLSFLQEKNKVAINYNVFFTNFPVVEVPKLRETIYNEIPDNDTSNPWLKEYWGNMFNCSWNSKEIGWKLCRSEWSLSLLKERRLKISESWSSSVYDSVFIFAKAMDKIRRKDCPNATENILKSCITGPKILQKIQNGVFSSLAGKIIFNKAGDAIGDYNIVQFTEAGQRRIAGRWFRANNTITWENFTAMWYYEKKPRGICSHPCPPKSYRLTLEISCCWQCRTCRENEVIINNSSCSPCPKFTWPDKETATTCLKIKPWSSNSTDTSSLWLELLAVLGLVCELCIAIMYLLNRNVPLIKASSLVLSNFSLIGVSTTFVTVFIVLSKPNKQICSAQRVLFNLSYTIMYAPLICKVARLLRIFKAGSTGTTNLSFVKDKYQVVFTGILILIQIGLTVITFMNSPVSIVMKQPISHEKYVEITCDYNMTALIFPLAYNILICAICCILSFFSRKFPENFNEASHIFCLVSATLFVWIVLLSAYFTTPKVKHQVLLLASCSVLNGYMTLLLMFLPKIYALKYVEQSKLKFIFSKSDTTVAPSVR